MIPEFDAATGALPAGIYESDWAEVAARFGITPRRRELLAGMRQALRALAYARCTRVYLGGSFVAAKAEPGDWDGCFDTTGVLKDRLPDAILEESRIGMKRSFGGEMFVSEDEEFDFLAFFRTDRRGRAVGVVALDPHTAQ